MESSKILFVLTSHNQIDKIAKPTGWYASEVAHPFYVFRRAGYQIDWASPLGGEAPLDPGSIHAARKDEEVKKFLAEEHGWKSCTKLADVAALPKLVHHYAAVFYPGGHGPMYDLPFDKDSQKIIASFYDAGKPTSALCHASAALANVVLKDGSSLARGRKMTGLCNSEERAVKLADAVPYSVETRLEEVGALFSKGTKDWAPYVVIDGNLVTGQNPASAKGVADAVVRLLKGPSPRL